MTLTNNLTPNLSLAISTIVITIYGLLFLASTYGVSLG